MPTQYHGVSQLRDLKGRLLAREALRTKWAEPQSTNTSYLGTMCPFCADAWANDSTCTDCLAPPSLCADKGRGGLIGLLLAQHGDFMLRHLPPTEFTFVRTQLLSLAKDGLAGAILRAAVPPTAETVPPK